MNHGPPLPVAMGSMIPRTLALIPAAGEGRRFGRPDGKQFVHLAGIPLLARTLIPFQRSQWICEIILVAPPANVERVWDEIVRAHEIDKVKKVVPGGRLRQDSVRLGLEAAGPSWDLVLIHDGARPLVTVEMISRCVQETQGRGATFTGVPAIDTIKQVNGSGLVVRTLERERLWMVQTPQTFRHDLIVFAHRQAQQEGFIGTDDASLVERLGHEVWAIPGSYENIKVTTRMDLSLAEEILAQREARGARG